VKAAALHFILTSWVLCPMQNYDLNVCGVIHFKYDLAKTPKVCW